MPYIKPPKGGTEGHVKFHFLVLHDNTYVHKKNYNELIYLSLAEQKIPVFTSIIATLL